MLLLLAVIVSGLVGAVLQHYLPRLMSSQVAMETIYEEIPHVREQLRDEADELVAAGVEAEYDDKVALRELYQEKIRPFLEKPEDPAVEPPAEVFESLRVVIPAVFHPIVDDLENICEEERQLNRQIHLYRWLHGWLLVHVPLSIVLLVLGGVHAVMALRY
jgi:hypothetical protein